MMGYAHNNKIKVEQEPVEVSPGLKKSNVSIDQSFIEFEEYHDTFLDSLLNFDGWVEDHPNSSLAQVMNSAEKPIVDKPSEIKKENEEEVIESAKLGDLGDLIQEGMGRVRLTSGVDVIDGLESSDVAGNEETTNAVNNEVKNVDEKGVDDLKESDDSEEEDSSSSSSASSSSSSSDDDDDDDDDEEEDEDDDSDDEEEVKGVKKVKGEVEMEEGEIRDFEVEDEDEDGDVVKGPIRSKNEVQDLPPVPPVTVSIEPHHKTQPVGVVLSIMGAQVIVEGVEKHNPLSEGSILWMSESRLPLGVVDEIFGPVKNPYYIVRYNSESDVPTTIQQGSAISFVPEFADYVLNNNNLYKKGYDASGENDEELDDEIEFSDDEKEAEYKKMIKMSKRGSSEQKNGNAKKDKKSKNRGGHQNNNSDHRDGHQNNGDRRQASPPGFSPGQASNGPASFSPGPQAANFSGPPPGVWPNGFPIPPQNMGFFPNGPFMQPNFTQQPFQNLGMPNMAPFHPQFNNTGQMFPPNFGPNPAFGPWPVNMGQNNNFSQPQVGPPMGFPGMFPGPSMNNGGPQGVVMGNGGQMENNGGGQMQRPPFVAGNGEMNQNRGGRKGFQRGGGRFRGGRGGRGGGNGPQSR